MADVDGHGGDADLNGSFSDAANAFERLFIGLLTPGWTPEQRSRPQSTFARRAAEVRHRLAAGTDHEVDVVLRAADGMLTLVQCKSYHRSEPRPAPATVFLPNGSGKSLQVSLQVLTNRLALATAAATASPRSYTAFLPGSRPALINGQTRVSTTRAILQADTTPPERNDFLRRAVRQIARSVAHGGPEVAGTWGWQVLCRLIETFSTATQIRQIPEPTQPPGRIVTASRRPPRGPDQ
jgi:hypothetical protein